MKAVVGGKLLDDLEGNSARLVINIRVIRIDFDQKKKIAKEMESLQKNSHYYLFCRTEGLWFSFTEVGEGTSKQN